MSDIDPAGLQAALNSPDPDAVYRHFVSGFLNSLKHPPQAEAVPPQSPESASPMPRTEAELRQVLDAGMRATFDTWTTDELPAIRNGDLRLEIRHDTLRQVHDGVQTTSQGYWIVDVACARTGLQSYLDASSPSGKRVEFRSLDAITEPASLLSWIHAPASIYHPKQGLITIDRSVDPETGKSLKHGYVFCGPRIEERPDGEQYLIFTVVLDTLEIVEAVRRRELVEVSAGYVCLFVHSPGQYRGTHYDGLQTQIRINHLAFLPAGYARAGQYACIQLDQQDAECFVFQHFDLDGGFPMGNIAPTAGQPQPLRQVRLDASTFVNLAPSDATLVENRLTALTDQVTTLSGQVSTLTGEKAELKGRVDGFTTEKQTLEQKIQTLESQTPPDLALVLDTLEQARPFLGDGFKVTDLPAVDVPSIQLAALKKALPQENFDSEDWKEPAYVKGRFASLRAAGAPVPPKPPVGGAPSANAQQLFDALSQQAQGGAGRQDSQRAQDPPKNPYLDSLERATQERIYGVSK